MDLASWNNLGGCKSKHAVKLSIYILERRGPILGGPRPEVAGAAAARRGGRERGGFARGAARDLGEQRGSRA